VLPAGTEVGGYRVIKKIGQGGMATVYEAKQVALGRVVALKVLAPDFADDGEEEVFRQRFERERRALAELDHPHVVTVFAGGPSPHGQWLAMQLVRGRTLAEMIEAERLAPTRVWELLTPIADALEAAHRTGLIHRDVTPGNILVDDDGTPFLADFGLTKKLGERTLTEPGGFLGTPQYVAPEQLRAEEAVVPASDVYSLTAVLYKCLCGRPPFQRGSMRGFVAAHLWEEPPPITALDESLPAGLDEVIARGMAKDAADRFETPGELIAAARESFAGGAPAGVVSPVRRRLAGLRALRTKRWSVRASAAAALLLFALSFGAGALADEGTPPREQRVIRAGPLQVAVPAGWVAKKGALKDRLRFHLGDSVVLRSGGEGGGVATIGISLARGQTLLPGALRPFDEHPQGEPVSLGSLQALRYDGLGPEPKRERWSAIVSPTSVGVATIACSGRPGGKEALRTCERLAGSLRLREGVGYPVGPSAQLAVLLRRQLGRLDRDTRALRRRLEQARRRGRQAAAASALAKAFRRCATTLSAAPASPQEAAHVAALVVAARWVRDAYKRLAAAARSSNRRAFHAEAGEVYLTESILYNRILYLRSLGYRVANPI
jgi:tRNA A-37 threonylcarbamoyl transferase component Bud32